MGAFIPNARPDVVEPPTLKTVGGGDLQIFTVVGNDAAAKEDCFVKTTVKNVLYCIPNVAANSKRVFSLLAQLIKIEAGADNRAH